MYVVVASKEVYNSGEMKGKKKYEWKIYQTHHSVVKTNILQNQVLSKLKIWAYGFCLEQKSFFLPSLLRDDLNGYERC